ncbi:hypothetical protein TNCV_3265641 [Trichonephila clavipes]|nr:hypothetical protein TNCV_3265641 [Trichonephila clavipes]
MIGLKKVGDYAILLELPSDDVEQIELSALGKIRNGNYRHFSVNKPKLILTRPRFFPVRERITSGINLLSSISNCLRQKRDQEVKNES